MERKQRVEKRLRGLALAEGRSRLWPVMWLMGLVILRALFMILLRDGDVVVLIGRRLHAEVDVVRTLFQLLLLSLRLSCGRTLLHMSSSTASCLHQKFEGRISARVMLYRCSRSRSYC